MSSRRVAELDDECLTIDHEATSDPYALQVIPMAFEWARDHGYPINDVESRYTGVSLKEDGNDGYLVMEIRTLEYPQEIADVAVDSCTLWICSCRGWHYHHNSGMFDEKRPSEAQDCPHVEKCKRKERQAVDDDSQTELGGLGD